jgi:hypothetical protein
MADVQHSAITDPEIHEPKGVATAANGRVYISNGVGSGAWNKVQDGNINSESSASGSVLESDGGGNAVFVKRMYRYNTSVGSPTIVAANTTAEHTVTVTGVAAATDEVLRVIKPTHQAGLSIGNARITADNQVIVQFINNTASGITPTAAELYSFYVWRR